MKNKVALFLKLTGVLLFSFSLCSCNASNPEQKDNPPVVDPTEPTTPTDPIDPVTPTDPVIHVESVSLNETEITLIVGDAKKLDATVLPENATNKDISWLSSNNEIVTVEDGLLTAIGVGEAEITVTTVDLEKTATAHVAVKKPKGTPNPNLLLTEMSTGSSTYRDRAVEISNIGDEDIILNDYSLNVYRNRNENPSNVIPLDGHVIKAKSSFVIAYQNAKEEILDKADLVTDQYLNDGTFPVALAFDEEPFDSIGTIGYIHDFAQGAVLVRLKEYFYQSLDFNLYHWVRYPIDTLNTLGNYDVISQQALLEGPKLTAENFDTPFCYDASKGTGGAIEVKYVRNYDGDTTLFNYGYTYSSYDVSGSLSTRYYAINTPEIAHSPDEVADPYGNEARDFTAGQLSRAKHYVVQSVNGYSLHETYGRMLGYVWVAFKDNPEPSDYYLLNFLIVKEGLSRPGFLTRSAEYNSLMLYNEISYVEYIYYAEQYAIAYKLNLHSGD